MFSGFIQNCDRYAEDHTNTTSKKKISSDSPRIFFFRKNFKLLFIFVNVNFNQRSNRPELVYWNKSSLKYSKNVLKKSLNSDPPSIFVQKNSQYYSLHIYD